MPGFLALHVRFLASLCASLVLFSSLTTFTYAQQSEQDFEAPTMEHDALEFSPSDSVQVFTATVADNTSLKSVQLFYRYQGDYDYIAEDMNPVADTSVFSARISVEESSPSKIEYYIQAEDEAGNVVLKGYAFAPLERDLSTAESKAETGQAIASEKPKSKVLYYVLGALAAGAVAAAVGGGSSSSGGGGDNTCGSAGCPVTFTVGTP